MKWKSLRNRICRSHRIRRGNVLRISVHKNTSLHEDSQSFLRNEMLATPWLCIDSHPSELSLHTLKPHFPQCNLLAMCLYLRVFITSSYYFQQLPTKDLHSSFLNNQPIPSVPSILKQTLRRAVSRDDLPRPQPADHQNSDSQKRVSSKKSRLSQDWHHLLDDVTTLKHYTLLRKPKYNSTSPKAVSNATKDPKLVFKELHDGAKVSKRAKGEKLHPKTRLNNFSKEHLLNVAKPRRPKHHKLMVSQHRDSISTDGRSKLVGTFSGDKANIQVFSHGEEITLNVTKSKNPLSQLKLNLVGGEEGIRSELSTTLKVSFS